MNEQLELIRAKAAEHGFRVEVDKVERRVYIYKGKWWSWFNDMNDLLDILADQEIQEDIRKANADARFSNDLQK